MSESEICHACSCYPCACGSQDFRSAEQIREDQHRDADKDAWGFGDEDDR